MRRKSFILAITLLSLSYAYAANGSGSIGTVSARGNLRIDGYQVWSNGTLFDGSTVEADQASVTLRLNNGAEIMLQTSSRAVVHSDHLELLQGATQLKALPSPFQVDVRGLRITSNGSSVSGVVSLSPANAVEVAAVSGELRVAGMNGLALARVPNATAVSFDPAIAGSRTGAAQANPSIASFQGYGMVSAQGGHYYLEISDGTRYELVGRDVKGFVNDKVWVEGTYPVPLPAGTLQLTVTHIEINGGGGNGNKQACE